MTRLLTILELGRMDYGEALAIQERIHAARVQDRIGDVLLLVEHPPVITLGRSGRREHILAEAETLRREGVSIHEVSRGGDVTYHGPGQLVGYPIFKLRTAASPDRVRDPVPDPDKDPEPDTEAEKAFYRLPYLDIRDFLISLEMSIINLLSAFYGIKAHREEGVYTGVWVDNAKICAFGIAVRRAVTMHGFAFNINTNLDHFRWIVPCGLPDRTVTSIEKLTGNRENLDWVGEMLVEQICHHLDANPVHAGMGLLDELGDSEDEDVKIRLSGKPGNI